jgi:hypothetical protein
MQLQNTTKFHAPFPWRKLLVMVIPPSYRPELHYMRGPGPKWHEKHSPPESRQTSVVSAESE